jgi:hypothetical protein
MVEQLTHLTRTACECSRKTISIAPLKTTGQKTLKGLNSTHERMPSNQLTKMEPLGFRTVKIAPAPPASGRLHLF